MQRKKQWIAFHAEATGELVIDAGAVSALLERGKSLLAVGVTEIRGTFSAGDVVKVRNTHGRTIGCGVIRVDADQLRAEIGNHKMGKAIIHRDEWVALS
jgi:Glutamate 5-kinase